METTTEVPIGCDLHKVNVQYQCELVVFTNPFIHGYIYQKPQLTKVKQVMRVNLAITNHLYIFLNPRSCWLNNHFPMFEPLAVPYPLGAPPIGSNAQRIARPRTELLSAQPAQPAEGGNGGLTSGKSVVLGDHKTRHT